MQETCSHVRWSVVADDVSDAADAVAVVDTSAALGEDGILRADEEEDWYGGIYHVDHFTNTPLDNGLE